MGLREIFQSKMALPEYFETYVRNENLYVQRKVCCPLHDERTPSFIYMRDTDTFSCFGCGKAGSIIELHYYLMLQENERTTKQEAIEDLAKILGISLKRGFEELIIDGSKVPDKYYFNKLLRSARRDVGLLARIDILTAFGNNPHEVGEILKIGTKEKIDTENKEHEH